MGVSPLNVRSKSLKKRGARGINFEGEIHWRQKARVKWVKEGDCNSKFFHKVANGRRNRKYIKSLENETGLVLNNAVSITEEILLYFEKLYANPIGESWSIEGLDWSPISEESAISLVAPFTEEEISKAIFQMDRDKAPGPDGFTIAVFQDCWDVIKEDLVRVFAEFIGAELSIKALMPLSLFFAQKKQIMDAVLIANEIVDERRRSGEEGVIFKIDFEKAYDHVRWDFLDQVLEKKGFSPKWRKWMNGCLSSVSYAVLVNGSAKGWEEDLQTLKSLLIAFGHISGLKVNLDKSNIYGINLDHAHISRLAETLGCKASGWPILYLGLPLGGNPGCCKNREVAEGFFMVRDWGRQKGSFSQGNGCGGTLEGFSSMASVLGPTRPFSWNLNFRRNLSDSEIEDLEGLMRSLDGVHLSPSVPDARLWPLSSSGLFSSFIWLVAHKKVNTNDMLQVRRPYKALSSDICILCMKHGESADHIFLHCSLTIGLWHRLFQLAKMDWVPPRSILDMMYIKFNGFGSSKRG
ncbi:Transposon TX1 uncharacterized 149 kDa protein [Vitis vinifera]|uniref:Transposon TX1 uncharacterized 149 kDa protein n=1 Tax=Vitis vinifera TaxID=29760 RepID=A0A438CJP3_VITVI|nr:Transposon TX1 uncharacterized 149 kDa protein [Vitis vinifera]